MAATPRLAVDVAIVLAMDCSGSISNENQALQLRGYATAVASDAFLAAIRKLPTGRAALTFLQWNGALRQHLAIPWTVITDPASAQDFAARVLRVENIQPDYTSISGAIDRAAALLRDPGFAARRAVIDISGDGANNDGRPVEQARDAAIAAGITVNGLPIIAREPDIASYYSSHVIGGPGAFIEIAQDEQSFPPALLRKLTTEVAGAPTGRPFRA